LKEKTMAAYKAGIRTVIIPKDNVPDLQDVDNVVKDTIEFIPVTSLNQVWNRALRKDGSAL
ncbi:MAG: hypothetical protein J6T17_09485, partial [Clostridia bacterium]|nr:hypothetical protein [Clostridia bacterium]